MNKFIFTSESVTEGHPDKIADQISDGVLDYIIKRDPSAKVACETFISKNMCVIGGEIKTETYAPIEKIAKDIFKDIGYCGDIKKYPSVKANNLHYKDIFVLNCIGEQSKDINNATDKKDGDVGAGDQGLMFGFACKDTDVLMPMPIFLAHLLSESLSDVRKKNILDYLYPDGKTQVSIEYVDSKPKRLDTVIVSAHHSENINQKQILEDIKREVIYASLEASRLSHLIDKNTKININPSGNFTIGGSIGDAGLTGRKIIVDTYGGFCPHGGGAFSGKDPSKVDRSGAYMLRFVAKNLVFAGVCDKITIQVAYAIGKSEPVSVMVNTYNTSSFSDSEIVKGVREIFDLRPKAIIDSLDLKRPIYRKTSIYGHFGRELDDFLWEKTNKVEDIKLYFKI